MLFSQRNGYKSVREVIQKESLDNETLSRLWNVFHLLIRKKIAKNYGNYTSNVPFLSLYRHKYFKKRVDEAPSQQSVAVKEIKQHFFSCQRYEVFDFIEFSIQSIPINNLAKEINNVLKEEVSAYRIINGYVLEITSEQEIGEIELALSQKNSYFVGKSEHLNKALEFLSDRSKPDYRNSTKESISALENVCREITGKKTLGEALKNLGEAGIAINDQMKEGFIKLYAYSNNTRDGIRHAIMSTGSTIDFDDAKFFLVACSAFINYLIGKTGK